jgi:2-keto-4-pentenoate hydratase/2-oxohepta-3-ene-1,7-dioic acid hydratase in catechol pathway
MQMPGLGHPIQNIYCIGRNYAEHAAEMKSAVPKSPIVFLKPTIAACETNSTILLPRQSDLVHHEVEVVVGIGKRGSSVPEESAMDLVEGFAVGIDVTARDLQEQAKKSGLPWAMSKGFPTFAPMSPFVKARPPLTFSISVNGAMRQRGNTEGMIFSIPKLISHLSSVFTLLPGDLIFTGTPSGVGPLNDGDEVLASLGNLATLTLTVRRSPAPG